MLHGVCSLLLHAARCLLHAACCRVQWVDEVVEDAPWVLDEAFLKKHKCVAAPCPPWLNQGVLKGYSRGTPGVLKGCSRVNQGVLKGYSRGTQGLGPAT